MTETQTDTNPEEKVVESPQETLEEPKKDRTREQFEKLSKSNQELKAERDKYKNVLESLRPEEQTPQVEAPSANQFSHLNQQQVNNITQGLVDDQGYVDMNKLGKILQETNDRALRAEQAAQRAQSDSQKSIRDFEESRTMREIHKEFPELDPKSDSFNEDYYDAVRNELVGQMLKGQREDVKAAAAKWHKRLIKKEESKEEREKREQGEAARAAIQTTPSKSQSKGRFSNSDIDDLKRRTMLGDREALKERLKRSGY